MTTNTIIVGIILFMLMLFVIALAMIIRAISILNVFREEADDAQEKYIREYIKQHDHNNDDI